MNTKQIEINDIDSDAAEFSLQELVNVVILLVIIGIVAVAGLDVVSDYGDDFAAASAERNASDDTITAISKIPSKLGIIVGAIVGAVIIGIIIRYFGGFTRGQ